MSLVKDRDELVPEVPHSNIPASPLCCDDLTPAQRADIDVLQQSFANVFFILSIYTTIIQHHAETCLGVMVPSQCYRLHEHKRKALQKD